jgi:phosphate transport system substrate-binding protein
MRRLLESFSCVVIAAVLLLPSGCKEKGGADGGVKRIGGGGATFIDPIMQKWSAEYKQAKDIEIDYKKSGSGNGIQQMSGKVLDFGCTDAPMNKEETATADSEGGPVLHVPMIMGAVALVYNLPEVKTPIQLTGPILAKIYLGDIKTWNDPELVALNPELKDVKTAIVPVYRSESSGTTSIFTEYLSKVAPEFKKRVGTSKNPKWPNVGLGQNGNDGVAGHVQRNVGCLGYVEMYYAKNSKLPFVSLQNKSGKFVLPESSAVTAAAEAAMKEKPSAEPYTLHELTFSLTDAVGDKVYPICGASYTVLYKKQKADKGKTLVEFLKWATTEGQKFAGELEYAELPQELRAKIAERLSQVDLQ